MGLFLALLISIFLTPSVMLVGYGGGGPLELPGRLGDVSTLNKSQMKIYHKIGCIYYVPEHGPSMICYWNNLVRCVWED